MWQAPASPDEIRARLEAAAVCDGAGYRLCTDGAPPSVVVGVLGEGEPLAATDEALVVAAGPELVEALTALVPALGAARGILALREDFPGATRTLRRAAEERGLEVRSLPAAYPMDAASVLLDLAASQGQTPAEAGLADAAVVDVPTLDRVSRALSSRCAAWRSVTVVGAVEQPKVLRVPLGTLVADLVRACGGSRDAGWIPFVNGVLGGRPSSGAASVELDTRLVVVLPHRHPLVVERSTPLADLVRQGASACVRCRICTEVCPVHLGGGRLEPHLVMAELSQTGLPGAASRDARTPAALECTECGLCSVACPARVRPAELTAEVARALRARGVRLVDAAPLAAHPDRAGRRHATVRLVERLGLATYRPHGPLPTEELRPLRLVLPLRGPTGAPRLPAVQEGDLVRPADRLVLASPGSFETDVLSAVNGRVRTVGDERGVVIDVQPA